MLCDRPATRSRHGARTPIAALGQIRLRPPPRNAGAPRREEISSRFSRLHGMSKFLTFRSGAPYIVAVIARHRCRNWLKLNEVEYETCMWHEFCLISRRMSLEPLSGRKAGQCEWAVCGERCVPGESPGAVCQ